jgi:mannose-6-phosphate isomerase-like protein (cupin superfamily)
MSYKYLFDLNDEANWIYPSQLLNPDGYVDEDARTISFGEGEHKLYSCGASIMHKNVDGNLHFHEHYTGYETFFVDSGGLDIICNGKRAYVAPGGIVFVRPYEAHGMFVHEDTKYRGFQHDIDGPPGTAERELLEEKIPGAMTSAEFPKELLLPADFHEREEPVYEVVSPEDCPTIRHISRPLAQYKIDGATVKMITARWENGGVNEMWAAELEKGFCAQSVPFPALAEMYYVREGEIEFTVYDETFTAYKECVVKIPKYAPHRIVAKTDAVIYDVAGFTRWYAYFQDRESILKYAPDRAEKPETWDALRKKYGCQIASADHK